MRFFKGNIIRKIFLTLLAGVTFVATISSSLAWFKNGTEVTFNGSEADFNIDAGAEASYYGGGTGTENDPYIISNRLHLYNLAWLQYIGTYNKNSIKQLYFKVTADIDMNGITLPPIGTDQYPFLGHFDGQGHEISNLTISNDNPLQTTSAFGVMKPSSASLQGTVPPEIVGFFGVVGKLPTQDFTYDASVVSMNNFTISDVNVGSETSKTLIGLAAGYVNGSMTGVKVGGTSSLSVDGQTAVSNSITNKLSDYGLVGYAANKGAAGEYIQTLSKYYDSDDDNQGGGENWGGSIDMVSLFNRLVDVEGKVTTANPNPAYVYNESYLNDTLEGRVVSERAAIRQYSKNTGTDYAGNFCLTAHQNTRNDGDKIYLVGGHYVNKLYYSSINDSGYYIRDAEGHYLSYNGSALVEATADTACIWHFSNTSGTARIYTNYFSQDTLLLSTVYLRSNNNALTTTTTQNSATTWTLTKNGTELAIVYNNYHLVYYNNAWTLLQNGQRFVTNAANPDFYVLANANGTYYVRNNASNGGTVAGTNDINAAAQLTLDGSNRLTYRTGNTTYYLMLYYRNNSASFRWQTTIGANRYFEMTYDSTANTYSGVNTNNTRYYAYVNNNAVGVQTGSTTVNYLPCGYENIRVYNTLDETPVQKTGRQLTDNTGNMEFYNTDTTYFPINAYDGEQRDPDTNAVVAKQYEPTAKNTGYIVAGTTTASYAATSRSIVVSKYPRKRVLYRSVDTSGNLTHVKTINGNGVQDLNTSNLHKYNDYYDEDNHLVSGSKTKFENAIKGASDSRVGGLHFTSEDTASTFAIGKDNVVEATNVRVNGATYSGNETYQLPVYSIDFNLKKQGYINFFAGTYNGGYNTNDNTPSAGETGNNKINSFFSLHRVDRDPDDKTKIENIREIKGIYSSGNSVNYTYSYKEYIPNSATNQYNIVDEDGNAFNSSGLTLLFDTDWIGYRGATELQNTSAYDANDPSKGTLGAVFYFEIPVDSGEYCLGNVINSVDTRLVEGCYLMYLDIGANGTEGTDRYTGYSITTYVNPVSFPSGVDFAIEGLTDDGLGGETLCVFIDVNESGTITFTVNEEGGQGNPPAKDTIEIDDTSQISQFSYLSASADAESGFDITGSHLPAEYEDPPDSNFIVTRVSYMSIEKVTGEKYLITITDELDENGEVVEGSTVYHLTYTDANDQLVSSDYTLAQLQALIPAAEDYYMNTIRNQVTIVTLERISASSISFNAQLPELPWTTASNIYMITLNIPSSYYIRVSVTNSENYTVYINSETPLVFTNNTATYPEP